MRHLPPFDVIRRSLGLYTVKGELCVAISYDDFIRMLKLLLAGTDVDEKWYLEQYDDIREAVEEGRVASAKKHFVNDGYFEGRLPFPLEVDEQFYLARYPDVVEGIRNGRTTSAQEHFVEHGYREGRLPQDV